MPHSRKDLPRKVWAETLNTAAYNNTRTGPTRSGTETPFELLFGKRISIDQFKIFGTECYAHIPKQKRQTFHPSAQKGFLIGYCDDKYGYRIYIQKKIQSLQPVM